MGNIVISQKLQIKIGFLQQMVKKGLNKVPLSALLTKEGGGQKLFGIAPKYRALFMMGFTLEQLSS